MPVRTAPPTPFAPSLSKGIPTMARGGFDKLSPNGHKLSPNGHKLSPNGDGFRANGMQSNQEANSCSPKS